MNISISVSSILNDINILGEDSSKIALVGNNGSGKTTILKCLSGLCMATSGMINYDADVSFAFPLSFTKYNKWIRYIKDNVLFIDHPTLFYKEMSIKENIKYFSGMGQYNEGGIYGELERYNIEESLNKPIGLLSDGTKQKLLLFLALHCRKDMILIDEPEKNLDKDSIAQFYDDISRQKNRTIIIATHQYSEDIISKFHHIYEVNQGKATMIYENVD